MSRKKRIDEAFNVMAAKMDTRDDFFQALQDVEKMGHGIPAQYANDAAIMLNYESWKLQGSWRNSKAIVKKVRKAARKSVDNVARLL